MPTFQAQSKDGRLSLGSAYNRQRFQQFLTENPNARLKIEPLLPESIKQRGFFEGAVVPLIAYYQEDLDHRNDEDCSRVREWLKIEFNPQMVVIDDKVHKVPGSTKGKLQEGFLEKVMDWMTDQGYKVELLNPDDYKDWRDRIFPHGGPDNYIDYLAELNRLP